MQKFFFIDLETTGLDSNKDKILEVACAITDNKLNEIESYSAVPRHLISSLSMDSWCLDTHTKSGLLEEVAKSTVSLSEIEADLEKIVRRHFPTSRPCFAGNSVHFDKKFMEAHMPNLMKRFHYRIIDVSSFMLALSIYHGTEIQKDRPTAHRALPDIKDSIHYLKTYMERFK
jgi:oligoribonuclease